MECARVLKVIPRLNSKFGACLMTNDHYHQFEDITTKLCC